MPIQRYGPEHIQFDTNLPPGNPLRDAGVFPASFRLSSEAFHFNGLPEQQDSFFHPQSMIFHGPTVERWRQLIARLMPPQHMVQIGAGGLTLEQAQSRILHDVSFRDVNRAYRHARTADYNIPEEQSAAFREMLTESICTADAINLITRSVSCPDLFCEAWAHSSLPPPPFYTEMILVGEIKELLAGPLDKKHRAFLIGLLCQGLKTLAYSNRMFDNKFALVIHGHYFRRAIMSEGTLTIDLWTAAPGLAQVGGVPEHDIVEMDLYEFLLYGTGVNEDPVAVYHQLRPGSDFEHGAGLALSSFLQQAGQTWIDNTRGIDTGPLHLVGGGRYARIHGFNVESLARAASRARAFMEGLPDNLNNDTTDGNDEHGPYGLHETEDGYDEYFDEHEDRDREFAHGNGASGNVSNIAKTKLVQDGSRAVPGIRSVPSLTAPQSTSSGLPANSVPSAASIASTRNDCVSLNEDPFPTPENSKGDFMRDALQKIVDEIPEEKQLRSLHRPGEQGFTKAQQVQLRSWGKALRDAGLDLDEAFPL